MYILHLTQKILILNTHPDNSSNVLVRFTQKSGHRTTLSLH